MVNVRHLTYAHKIKSALFSLGCNSCFCAHTSRARACANLHDSYLLYKNNYLCEAEACVNTDYQLGAQSG